MVHLAHVCIAGVGCCTRVQHGVSGWGKNRRVEHSYTAADVARRAGVSRSAVSRAFTPGASVSTKARERILRAADHLGYRVNRLAQSLINARSNLIGLVGTDLQQPFHAELLTTLSAALLAGRLSMHVAQRSQCTARHECADRTRARVSRLRDRRDDREPAHAHRRGMSEQWRAGRSSSTSCCRDWPWTPSLPTTRRADGSPRNSCWPRVAAGSRRLERGAYREPDGAHQRISCARGRRRRAGACLGGRSYRLWRRVGTPRWRCSRKSPSTAFFASPICSHSVSWTPRERNSRRRVPDDLSVIGFDDIPQAGWSAYRLTTFHQPVARLTCAVMDVLRRRMEHTAPPHALTMVPVQLVVRSTVRGLAAAEEPA